MSVFKAMIVPPDDSPYELEVEGWRHAQDLVEGYTELVSATGIYMYVNEEARLHEEDFKPNLVASVITGKTILGTAVMFDASSDPDERSISDSNKERITKTWKATHRG